MIAYRSLFSGKSFSIGDIQEIINQFEHPALLIDAHHLIVAVNSALLEITAFTNDDLINSPLASLLIINTQNYEIKNEGALIRKTKKPIEITAELVELGLKRDLTLILIEIHEDEGNKKIEPEMIFSAFSKIYEFFKIDRFIENSYQYLKALLDLENVYFYEIDETERFFINVNEEDKQPLFPKTLPASELKCIEKIDVWVQGKRVLSEIHRTARLNEIFLVITIPFLKTEKKKGIVILTSANDKISEGELFFIEKMTQYIFNLAAIKQDIIQFQKDVLAKENLLNIYQSYFSNVPTGFVIISSQSRIVFSNYAFQELLKYKEFELVDNKVDLLFPADGQAVQIIKQIQSIKNDYKWDNVQLLSRAGEIIPVQMTMLQIESEGDNTKLIIVEDISQKIHLKSVIDSLNYKAGLGELVSEFAHEVRNPINNLSTGLQLLSADIILNPDSVDVIDRMRNDCVRLNNLMESVLSYSKPVEIQKTEMDITSFVQRIITKWKDICGEKNINIYNRNKLKVPIIIADFLKLEQVFDNLIGNAIEVMSESGGTLGIHLNQENDNKIVASISDTGAGIPEEILKDLFKPFVSFNPKGTGLGLAISKRIVEAHNGEIFVDTFPGGTIFHVHLPIR